MTLVQRLSTALALVFTTLIAGPAPAVASEPTTERNRQFIAQAFNQWAQGGRTFFIDVLAPDVIWTIKGRAPRRVLIAAEMTS